MSPAETIPAVGSDPLVLRLGKLLAAQERHLADYLDLLDRYEADIREDDQVQRLPLHGEAGRHLTRKITAFGKAIGPLLAGYETRPGRNPGIDERLSRINRAVREIGEHSQRIRDAIRREAGKVEVELTGLRIPKRKISPYGRSTSSHLIDISG